MMNARWAAGLFSLVCVAGAVTASTIATADPTDPGPVVSGPIMGGKLGHPAFDAPFDLGAYGYSESEYFVSGIAKAHGAAAVPAPFTTRIVVYRPTDPAKFSGTTVAEWDNVSGQLELQPEMVWAFPQSLRSGDAFVQVSAQEEGICDAVLTAGTGCLPTSLRGIDPTRYSALSHPGDVYSYDIFSQAVQAVRHPRGASPLGGLTTHHVVAVAESQSAVALDNYITTGADDAARVVDGFVIDADGHNAEPTRYRVPTITVWSEDSAHPTPTPNGPNHVTWSVTGAAHTDHQSLQDGLAWMSHTLANTPTRSRNVQDAQAAALGDYGQEGPSAASTCVGDDEFPRRYVVDAALADVETWIAHGVVAPTTDSFQYTGAARQIQDLPKPHLPFTIFTNDDLVGWAGAPLTLVHGGDGNAVGGLRLPVISVPVATYDATACILAGTSTPFTPEQLHTLYPTHADYVGRMIAATKIAVEQRFLTPADANDLLTRACGSAIPDFGTVARADQPAECRRPDRVPAGW